MCQPFTFLCITSEFLGESERDLCLFTDYGVHNSWKRILRSDGCVTKWEITLKDRSSVWNRSLFSRKFWSCELLHLLFCCCCCLQYMIPMRLTSMSWRPAGFMKKKKTPVKNEMHLKTNHNYRCILVWLVTETGRNRNLNELLTLLLNVHQIDPFTAITL